MQVIERSDHGTVSPRMTRIITASRFIRAARTATGGTSRWTPTRSTMPEWREGDGWRRTSEGLPQTIRVRGPRPPLRHPPGLAAGL